MVISSRAAWIPSPASTATGTAQPARKIFGRHTVCTVVTADFLRFQAETGNDLITPRPEYAFPGLRPGDRWCVVAARWRLAYDAGMAAPVVLAATHAAIPGRRAARRAA